MIATITNLTTGLVSIRKPFAALAASGTKTIAGVQFTDIITNPELLDLLSHSTISITFAADPADNAAISVIQVASELAARTAASTIGAGLAVAMDGTGKAIPADSTDGTKRAIGVSVAGAANGALCTFVKDGIASRRPHRLGAGLRSSTTSTRRAR